MGNDRDTSLAKLEMSHPCPPRSKDASAAPTLPQGTLVTCDLDPDADPVWAWPRRINTFRPKKPNPAPTNGARPPGCQGEEDGPCTCNQDCTLA